MRNPDGTLIGDLNDNLPANTSGSIVTYRLATINENETTYDLLPTVINKPPIIIAPIGETSTPKIKQYSTADASGKYLYLFPDGTIKINLGSTFEFKLSAQQPPVFNIENGIPKIIQSNTGLNYVWRKDGKIVTSYIIDSLNSRLTVENEVLKFENVQPEHAGAYTCEVSNDIGTTVSEPLNIEILNLDFDSYFYKNLVRNPYGKDGTNDWETNNEDLTTKPFSSIPSSDFARPNRVDLFGYTSDMLYPRPYQIDSGIIKGLDLTKDLVKGGSYFTRTRYKFDKKDGSFLVRAYQDIDLSEIEWLVKGGVYGVEGVRAMFSCYIGNALPSYIPVEQLMDPSTRIKPSSYVMGKPRLSIENFLNSGPSYGITENVYVTLEEYANETRLATRILQDFETSETKYDRITLMDPWSKRYYNYYGQKYYPVDRFKIGETSLGDARDSTLFIADELFPIGAPRYTYGQYVEFNKIIIDKLNPLTTKIRITLTFETNDSRLFEVDKDALDNFDEPFEFNGWQLPNIRNSFKSKPSDYRNFIGYELLSGSFRFKYLDKPVEQVIPASPDPRGLVTGLNLSLLPILTSNREITDYYTLISLAQNNSEESLVPNGLGGGRGFDPTGLNSRRLRPQFALYVDPLPVLDADGMIKQNRRLEFSFEVFDPTTGLTKPFPINKSNLYPYKKSTGISVEGTTSPLVYRSATNTNAQGQPYTIVYPAGDSEVELNGAINSMRYRYVQTGSDASRQIANDQGKRLIPFGWSLEKNLIESDRAPDSFKDIQAYWNGRARFQLFFGLPGAYGKESTFGQVDTYRAQTYFLTMDFSMPTSSIILSRTTEFWPGFGSLSLDIPHYINDKGVLICDLPNELFTTPIVSGGFGYVNDTNTINNYELITTGSPSVTITSLHANLASYSKVPLRSNVYYTQVVKQIMKPLEDDIRLLSSSIAEKERPLYYVINNGLSLTTSLSRPSTGSYRIVTESLQGLKTPQFYVSIGKTSAGIDRLDESVAVPEVGVPRILIYNKSGSITPPTSSNRVLYYVTYNADQDIQIASLTQPTGTFTAVTKSLFGYTSSQFYVYKDPQDTRVTEDLNKPVGSAYITVTQVPTTSSLTGSQSNLLTNTNAGFNLDRLVAFSQSLAVYAYDRTQNINTTLYKQLDDYYQGSYTIKVGSIRNNPQFNPQPDLLFIATARLEANRRPSLFAVKAASPSYFSDGIGAPTYGVDASGSEYTTTYPAIKDSYWKSY